MKTFPDDNILKQLKKRKGFGIKPVTSAALRFMAVVLLLMIHYTIDAFF